MTAARGARYAILCGALLSVAAAAPALAQTDAELKCQDTIAVGARRYFSAFFRGHYSAISKCENNRANGTVPPTVECRPRECVGGDNDGLACANALDCPGGSCDPNPALDAKTAERLNAAVLRLERHIAPKCTDPLSSGVVLGPPCDTPGLTQADLVDCIVNQAHGINAMRLVNTVYDETGAISDAAVLACQDTFAKESRRYAKKRANRRRLCAKRLAASAIPGPCPNARTRAGMDKDLTKFRKKVLAACSAAAVTDPSKNFGFPCERAGITTFKNLTFDRTDPTLTADIKAFRCVAAAAAGDADAGADTTYPMPDAAPFSFGVAAGEATATAFMAWTRLPAAGSVDLEVATDEAFTANVQTQLALPTDMLADNTVKTEVSGLLPGTEYFYRFKSGSDVSRTGRIRTAPLAGSTDPVTFVWTGDANAFFRPFTVLDGILGDDPDVWFFIGDTIYGDDPRSGSGVAVSRSDYHAKYRENRSDASLRNVMASFGTVSIWDDHEVTNDFYGTNPDIGFQAQMTAGNQAFRDYTPMRDDTGDPMQLYRNFQWGQAAEFFLIDDRQYRDPQAYITEPTCLDMGEPIVLPAGTCAAEINDPSRTYLGATQKQWLKDELLNSTATFKFVMNGPLISSLIYLPYDRWDGYAAEQQEIIDYIKTNDIRNVIFLSTDIHALIINRRVGNTTPPIIRELVSGAIGMDPIYRELPSSISPLVPQLPALFPTIDYFDIDRFNYGFIEVSTTQATVTYRDATGAALKTYTIPAT